jgi:hypothetical protein
MWCSCVSPVLIGENHASSTQANNSDGEYIQVSESPHFPGFYLGEALPDYLERSKIEGRNQTMKLFRAWVRQRK